MTTPEGVSPDVQVHVPGIGVPQFEVNWRRSVSWSDPLRMLADINWLSFENPDAPNSLRPREKPPTINIGINVQIGRAHV